MFFLVRSVYAEVQLGLHKASKFRLTWRGVVDSLVVGREMCLFTLFRVIYGKCSRACIRLHSRD